jgi:glycine/D-amino acid oxidase-like deaminating enzyme
MEDRIGVIGAGIVGLAVARRLGELEAGSELTVLDKEDRVGAHQTGHNSGVAHARVYYTPDSLKAKLCRRGIELLKPSAGVEADTEGRTGAGDARNVEPLTVRGLGVDQLRCRPDERHARRCGHGSQSQRQRGDNPD